MPVKFPSVEAFRSHGFDTVIDVRSPAEFAEDHIPGAINLPALSNEERAEIGTIYKQVSPFDARKKGAALVARNVAHHLETALANKPGGWRPLVYCWRGGQRSGSVATILREVGWRADTVQGGYKAFRKSVYTSLYETPTHHRLILIDGNTGSGKTKLLHKLAAEGAQMIDLEGLARHRGSLLGGIDGPQPAQKAFETALAMQLAALDPARPTYVEAESLRIGAVTVPPQLWAAMKTAPVFEIEVPFEERKRVLSADYARHLHGTALTELLERFRERHGAETVNDWQALAASEDYDALSAELMRKHYDPRYERSRTAHSRDVIGAITLPDLSAPALADAARRIIAQS